MSKIKTEEDSYALGSEYTDWDFNYINGYYTGVTYTSHGFINLYYQTEKNRGLGEFVATATIIHKGRVYQLKTYSTVTRLGWVRIAKKWAKAIWSQ